LDLLRHQCAPRARARRPVAAAEVSGPGYGGDPGADHAGDRADLTQPRSGGGVRSDHFDRWHSSVRGGAPRGGAGADRHAESGAGARDSAAVVGAMRRGGEVRGDGRWARRPPALSFAGGSRRCAMSAIFAASIDPDNGGREMAAEAPGVPPGIQKILTRFASLSPDLVRQALVQYANRLPPLPERFQGLDEERYRVHECQTPVAIYPEMREGLLYFHAEVPQGAPTIRALLAMIFEAVNGQPPEAVLAIPS